MRKMLSVLVVAAVVGLSLPMAAHAGATWNLAKDFRVCPSYANPNPDATGKLTWYFLRSLDKNHNPANYSLLPNFLPDVYHINGLSGWQGDCWDGYYYVAGPNIYMNATCSDYYNWPAGKVLMATTGCPDRMTIVGWKSPIRGSVNVNATFTNDPGSGPGDGITWSVDKGSSNLATGQLHGAEAAAFNQNITVKQGDFLYFIVDGLNSYYYDSVYLDLVITQL